MRQKYLPALGLHGFHRLAYTEWGDPENPKVLLCVHGLTRNGRDFDDLARALAADWRVICPDMPGRGESEWLAVKSDYAIPTYLADCAALIARLDVEAVDWLGTSLGGIIGMSLAALPGSPIRRLIVNDIGPLLPAAGLRRIAGFVGADPRFADRTEALTFLKGAMTTFGIQGDAQWQHILAISTRPAEGGGLKLHYDPGLGQAFLGDDPKDIDFWATWDAIRGPVLTLRGEDSDILLAETAREMTTRGPKTKLVEFSGCGHAPALMAPEQIAVIENWLRGESGAVLQGSALPPNGI
jgi:pimeloyl-ACP methyl ester carboxylesterase